MGDNLLDVHGCREWFLLALGLKSSACACAKRWNRIQTGPKICDAPSCETSTPHQFKMLKLEMITKCNLHYMHFLIAYLDYCLFYNLYIIFWVCDCSCTADMHVGLHEFRKRKKDEGLKIIYEFCKNDRLDEFLKLDQDRSRCIKDARIKQGFIWDASDFVADF